MNSKLSIIFTCLLLTFCESAFVDTLQKCTLDDPPCLKGVIQDVITRMGKDGIKEYNISSIDPMDLKNLKIPIPGLATIDIVEGDARGIKDCIVESVESDTKERRFVLNAVCDLNIKAKVKLTDVSKVIHEAFKTNAVAGGGNVKIKLDKLRLKLEYFYGIVKKEDGETYITFDTEKTRYEYELGEIKVVVDKFLFGDSDVSEPINELFKSNLPLIVKTFGKSIFDVALGIVNNIVQTFFDKTPSKYFINGDLPVSS